MFDTALIESANLQRRSGSGLSTLVSVLVHTLALGGLFISGYLYEAKNKVIETRIEAFLVAGEPAPPPPPPPPPPATSSTPQPVKAKVDIPETPRDSFVSPTKITELPDVEIEETEGVEGVEGGVPGGVEGGVAGGVVGGVVGGVIGGTLGGQLGGVLGGRGDAVRVGDGVKAPVPIHRVEPGYTESARRDRIEGVVILEAIIDDSGDVRDVRVLKSLPNGLDEEAIAAVRQWKFRPGTRDGKPIPVIFTLTIKFRLD
jgi:protein TonB